MIKQIHSIVKNKLAYFTSSLFYYTLFLTNKKKIYCVNKVYCKVYCSLKKRNLFFRFKYLLLLSRRLLFGYFLLLLV